MGAPSGGVVRTHNNNNYNTADYQPIMKPATIDDTNTETGTDVYKISAASTCCDVYLSLIQQYIGVFQIENALFLAERCIADYPNCYDAIYMQALCYYRLQKYKNARACLNSKQPNSKILQHQQDHSSSTSSTTDTLSSRYNSYSTSCSMQYLSAQCSYELGDYTTAETTLMNTSRTLYQQQLQQQNNVNGITMDEWILQSTPCSIPNGAAGLALLGNICRKSNRKERAIQYFYMSLQLDPFLFTSFQALAELGETTINLDASTVFGASKNAFKDITNSLPTIPSHTMDHTKTPLQLTLSTPIIPSSHINTTTTNRTGFATIATNAVTSTTAYAIGFETPGLTPIAHNTTIHDSFNHTRFNSNKYSNIPSYQNSNIRSSMMTPLASGAVQHSHQQYRNQLSVNDIRTTVMRRAKQIAGRQYYPPSPDTSNSALARAISTPVTSVTRSMRYLRGLGASNDDEMNTSSTGANRSLFPSSISENQDSNNPGFMTSSRTSNSLYTNVNNTNDRNVVTTLTKPETLENDNSVQDILNILTITGAAYHNLYQYRCKDSIQILQRLPISQQRTPWVLHQQGRAFLEQGDFVSAQRCFEYMHSIDPGRMQGLELLSTVYWQLKKEVDLANLAQRTMDWDFQSPQAHCVAGNCFSLQKDQETALVFFKRSLQLDPNFTYIHTLSGYEYMANEDFGKATSCFRKALQIDDRHYNAWYGLGMIYHRQEKYDLAEYHFERAVNIHPTSGVLRCNLGMAQNANGKAYVALETLSEAFRLDPRNPQARFQRATIYSALHRPEEALAELKIVRDAAPREATVHFALGKILKRLGRLDEAMKCFLTAMDLDPKDNQMIKSAMDKIGEPDSEEESTTNY